MIKLGKKNNMSVDRLHRSRWESFCRQHEKSEDEMKALVFNGELSKKEFRSLISCIFHVSPCALIFYPELFKRCPQLIDRCNWNLIECREWIFLLQERPEFSNKCDKWNKFDARNWFSLLSAQPQFADKCDKWDEFDGLDWRFLLSWHSQLATKCNWDKLNNYHFSDPWKRADFWVAFLKDQPQFSDKCDWSNFESEAWIEILKSLPQLADKCDKWDKFRTWDWSSLLCHQPQFVERFDLSRFGGWEWSEVLAKQPQLANKCYKWDNITGQGWQKLFKNGNGSFIDYCDLTTLSPYAWSWILRYLPQLADKCDRWNEFSAEDWGRLLFMQPKFADKCAWQKMNVSSILVYLLLKQPLLIQHCNITVITPKGKARLLAKHPELEKYFLAEKEENDQEPDLFELD